MIARNCFRLLIVAAVLTAIVLTVKAPSAFAVGLPIDLRTAASALANNPNPGGAAYTSANVVYSSSYYDPNRSPKHVSDGSGMTWTSPTWAGGDASGTHNTLGDNGWETAGDHAPQSNGPLANQWIAWNFGAVYTLDKVHYWNSTEENQNTRGLNRVDIDTSIDGSTWINVMNDVALVIGPNNAPTTGTDLVLPNITTQYLRFSDLQNAQSSVYGRLYEVVFYGTEVAPVPEPSTYALGLIGLAGLGLVVWRRRKISDC